MPHLQRWQSLASHVEPPSPSLLSLPPHRGTMPYRSGKNAAPSSATIVLTTVPVSLPLAAAAALQQGRRGTARLPARVAVVRGTSGCAGVLAAGNEGK